MGKELEFCLFVKSKNWDINIQVDFLEGLRKEIQKSLEEKRIEIDLWLEKIEDEKIRWEREIGGGSNDSCGRDDDDGKGSNDLSEPTTQSLGLVFGEGAN